MRISTSRIRRVTFVLGVAAFSVLPSVSMVSASAPPSGAATYNGNTIYLSQGWQGAHACGVVSSSDIICFDTANELTAALASQSSPAFSAQSSFAQPFTSCNGELDLYSDINFGGDLLIIDSPVGIGINLNNFGWGDTVSSWINQFNCASYAWKTTNGSGSRLTMGANGSNS